MKYDSLKKGSQKTLKIKRLSGGLELSSSADNINDNQLSSCKNVWYRNGSLQTRPGLSCDENKVMGIIIDGESKNKYKLHNAGLYLDGEYKRIATAEAVVDDYLYNCNVFLVGESGDYRNIGSLKFFRVTSEIFYKPINILFYNGKPQNGGGIFAMATTQRDDDTTDRHYVFFEISEDLTEWNRVVSFYVPTLYINGRGNKYEIAKDNNKISVASPQILESPNMLEGRFNSYFTSDGYSNSFRLPFANLASESVICRIYYNLVSFIEWRINGNLVSDTQTFFNQNITMEVDREKGTVYFTNDSGDYAIPAMSMYNENNIKITATKEIEKSVAKIIHSTCALKHQSRIMISGGESGNEIFVADYNNPLYFPQNSSVKVGDANSEVKSLSMQDGKIVALKQDGVYTVNFKAGKRINDISLLADNDKIFYDNDDFECKEVSKSVGCKGKEFTAVVNNSTVFLGSDRKIYALTSLNGDGLKCISKQLGETEELKYADFAFGGNNKYIIFKDNKALIAVADNLSEICWYYWEFPQSFKIFGGFWCDDMPMFLCACNNTEYSFIARLDDAKDNYLEYDTIGNIVKKQSLIESAVVTKHFGISAKKRKFESIYIALASKGNVSISVNGKQIADINLRLSDKEYQKNQYKSVKLLPYLSDKSSLYITLESKNGISVGDVEINYI